MGYKRNISLHHKSQSFNLKANANEDADDDNTGMECPKILNTEFGIMVPNFRT
jgi:hypothetical protein